MNRVLSIIILLLWSSIIRSQPVTEQEALEAVTSFLNTRDFHGTKLRDGRLNGRPHLSFSSSQLYAFDTGDRFILAGADRRLPSILGYSDHGTFNEAYTKSDCFRKMVRSMIQEKNPNFHIYKPSNVASSVSPLCQNSWHQHKPFNSLCPQKDGISCVTGCVAASMSEVMYYYRYPAHGTESFEYNDSSGCGQIVSSDFSSHWYDWDHMLPDYGYEGSKKFTDVESSAVGQLLYDCGVSVEMCYDQSSSSASVIRQPIALTQYFGYDEGMQMYYRNFFTQVEWDSLLFNELNEGRPILVGGWRQGNAHSYVCDGYDDYGFFHLRFGNPEELGNGYYYFTWSTPDIAPWSDANSIESGFNLLQSVLVGVRPKSPSLPTTQRYIYGFSHIDVLGGDTLRLNPGKGFDVGVYALCNCGWNLHDGIVGLALKPADSDLRTPKNSTTLLYRYERVFELEELTDSTYDDTLHISIPSSTKEGSYKLVPVYEENGEYVEARTMVGTPNYLTCKISANETVITSPSELRSRLEITHVDFPSVLYKNESPQFSYTIENKGEEYSGRLFICLYDERVPALNYNICIHGMSIEKGDEQTHRFVRRSVDKIPLGGTYHLRIMHDIDLLTDSMVVIWDDSLTDITIYEDASGIGTITEDVVSGKCHYFDLSGRMISSPALLRENSIYIEVDAQGRAKKQLKQNK